MEKTSKLSAKEIVYVVLIGIVTVAVMVTLLVYASKNKREVPAGEDGYVMPSETDSKTVIKEKEKFVEVKKTITTATIEAGLNEMGFLVTEEYWFTDVVSNSKEETALWIFKSEANYTIQYDGSVFAGVDFTKIKVEKNDSERTITVTVPTASIKTVEIDYDSFKVLSEKDGLWAHMDVRDFNDSLSELTKSATNKALKRGIVENAQKNAVRLVEEFVANIIENTEESYYKVLVRVGK